MGCLETADEAEPVGETIVADAAAVAEFGALLDRAFDGIEFDGPESIEMQAATSGLNVVFGSSRLVLECADERSLALWAALGDRRGQPVLSAPRLRVRFADDSALAARLRELQQRAEANAWRVHASARRSDELDDLPPTLRTLHCRYFTGDEFASLQRLPALEALTVRDSVEWMVLAPTRPRRWPLGRPPEDALTTDGAHGIARLMTLQRLEVPAGALDDEAMRAFASMPALRSLTLTGSVEHITGVGFAAFGDRLEQLRILQKHIASPAPIDQLRAIASLPSLRELWIDLAAGDAATARCLASMPAVRYLAIAGHRAPNSDELLRAIASTRVEKLMLQDMVVTRHGLAALTDLPTLRDVDLRFVGLDFPGAYEALAGLRQVRRLDVRGSGLSDASVENLRVALPACTVIASSEGERAGSVSLAAPSWSRD